MSLPISFKPNKNFKLIRLGSNNDGGYLIGNQTINDTKTLVSFGILDDCSFEKDFKEKKTKPTLFVSIKSIIKLSG